eukprot:GHVR01096784.1.p2 GENE.GHVR01096784.1~~GHVR01096784.1.p2  ORF type:complete len:221 (-),score=22.52 GHVR01096784.1:1115-1777(-)
MMSTINHNFTDIIGSHASSSVHISHHLTPTMKRAIEISTSDVPSRRPRLNVPSNVVGTRMIERVTYDSAIIAPYQPTNAICSQQGCRGHWTMSNEGDDIPPATLLSLPTKATRGNVLYRAIMYQQPATDDIDDEYDEIGMEDVANTNPLNVLVSGIRGLHFRHSLSRSIPVGFASTLTIADDRIHPIDSVGIPQWAAERMMTMGRDGVAVHLQVCFDHCI